MRQRRRWEHDSSDDRAAPPAYSPPPPPATTSRQACSGPDIVRIEPDASMQDALWRLVGGYRTAPVRHAVKAVLWPDPRSPYDSRAVAVWCDGELAGWLGHADSAAFYPQLTRWVDDDDRAATCGALVESVRHDEFGRALLGVELRLDRAALHVSALPAEHRRSAAVPGAAPGAARLAS